MDNLKPCPFCGGKAKLEDMGFPHHVFCTECGARVTGKGFAEDGEKDAILKWNRRVETVMCKDCEWRGNKKKCILAFIADKQEFPLFFYDQRGEWFCADGERKEDRSRKADDTVPRFDDSTGRMSEL